MINEDVIKNAFRNLKSEQITDTWDKINFTLESNQNIKTNKHQYINKKMIFRYATCFIVIFAIIGVSIFCNLGISPIQLESNSKVSKNSATKHPNNMFTLTAYAENNSTPTSKINLSENAVKNSIEVTYGEGNGCGRDGMIDWGLYFPLGYKCDGKNIAKVTFNVDKGSLYHKRIYTKEELNDDKITGGGYMGSQGSNPDDKMVYYNYISIGNSQTLEYVNSQNNDAIIYWGVTGQVKQDSAKLLFSIEHDYINKLGTINLEVTVLFKDGQTAMQSIFMSNNLRSVTVGEIKYS